ncbi:MAG: hypothetical protein LBN26_06575 [Christensenellaceae bacterium]|jgi:dipeptidyl aminopeptidase/acylaminoacyl peptidase|nr:hypothetical protein [Christensenellaceae bacterium]
MRRGLLAITLLLCTLLCACAKGESGNKYVGYTLQGELSGGDALEEANLSALTVRQNGESTQITLRFKSGSRMSGSAAERAAQTLPGYRVWALESPARLLVRFEGLQYYDYERQTPPAAGLVRGSFRYGIKATASAAQGEAAAAPVYICFQLLGSAAFKTQESGSELAITLIPREAPKPAKNQEPQPNYYVFSTAYQDFCAGRLMGEQSLFAPAFAADMTNIVLLSTPFSSEIEAEYYKNQLLSQYAAAIPAEWRVIALEPGELPAYDESMQYQAAYQQRVIRQGQETIGAPVLLADGLYLAAAPRRMGGGALYSKRVVRGADAEAYASERLYILDNEGHAQPLTEHPFITIEQALFSPDGRTVAVLERAEENTNLYLVDTQQREVTAELTSAGFGNQVSAIAWDSMGSMLFAVSGNSEVQVHAYDLNVPEEAKRHTVVAKSDVGEGSIAYCDGEVYFVESGMEGDAIYRVKPEGGVPKKFLAGSAFALSPNNAYMAVSESGINGQRFLLYDMQTGKQAVITSEFAVYNYLFSPDGARVYYFENRLTGGLNEGSSEEIDAATAAATKDPYPYTLWVYDIGAGQSRPVCDLPGTAIFAAPNAQQVYFDYYDEETMGEKVRATYIIPAQDAVQESEGANAG